jgi:hypothetical protein
LALRSMAALNAPSVVMFDFLVDDRTSLVA